MNEETIVAVYDSAGPAMEAVRELEAAGIPSSAITQHTNSASSSSAAATGADMTGSGLGGAEATGGLLAAGLPGAGVSGAGLTGAGLTGTGIGGASTGQGFWASLFGGEPEHEHDTAVYDRSMQSGSIVITVKAPAEHITQVSDILERHDPIDIDERASGYGTSHSTTVTSAVTGSGTAAASAGLGTTAAAGSTDEGGTLKLSEETLAVGKRAVNRGTTRVRRYVVETPVEEQVTLREEKVSIERRPVTDGRLATSADFSDKTIEVRETAEEAVISKTARVREEVVIHKEAAERTETVRDTVRREDVEITRDAATTDRTASTVGAGTTTGTTTTTTTKPII